VSSLASNRTLCDRRFSVADPSVRTLHNALHFIMWLQLDSTQWWQHVECNAVKPRYLAPSPLSHQTPLTEHICAAAWDAVGWWADTLLDTPMMTTVHISAQQVESKKFTSSNSLILSTIYVLRNTQPSVCGSVTSFCSNSSIQSTMHLQN